MSDEPNTTAIAVESFRDVILIDEGQLHKHLDAVVRDSVERVLNALLDAKADRLCNAQRYERSGDRLNTRVGGYILLRLLSVSRHRDLSIPAPRASPLEPSVSSITQRRHIVR